MYSARDRVENEPWLTQIERAADRLDLGSEARSVAADLFLSEVPETDRSKSAIAAASLYAGALIAGEERSQSRVADAMDVSRLSVQQHWKPILETAGFRPPSW
ncbi:cyclin family protein [Halobellus clavatus]|jgi:transcription initiation factor TFIIIB Brf1 subunit/transcription initiation factor TFIIB|uniref:Transcription factor TFIIB repeat-containing protein n=1 Tax=Halobellus clavatus TaxID=660517 RepID=A0A1H3F9P1_9EURY|nr:cyclin [Halobellus clavatus]SDX87660.1 Transcription factor TFIIB repeat-containing protein [Halobellus clavatus]